MTMFLSRAAVIAVGEPPVSYNVKMTLGPARLSTVGPVTIDGKPVGVICVAHVPLSVPPPVTDGAITIPQAERESAEFALETTARLIALDYGTSHKISSPMPFVGFWSAESEELDALDGAVFKEPVIRAIAGAIGRTGLLDDAVVPHLLDRLDGAALLAEALNNESPLGRYMQLMRLFERAFATGPHEMTVPLATLLADCGQGFTLDEVEDWTNARGLSIHADRRAEFFLDADVRLFMPRMLQAGFDVLLNKAEWRKKSSTRRQVWRLKSGSQDRSGGIFLTKGEEMSIAFQALDAFAAYPLVIAGPIEQALPLGLWLQGGADGGVLRPNEGTPVSPLE